MSLPTNPEPPKPTCGVVIQKQEGTLEEIICPEVATQLVSIVDPNNTAVVTAVILVCDKHDHDLEDGKTLILKAENQEEHIAVQFKQPEVVSDVSN